MPRKTPACIPALVRAGISESDALALRRVAMTLHRWHELECGYGDDSASWCLVRGHAPRREFYRDPETQAPKWRTVGEFVYDDNGLPYIERHFHNESGPRYSRVPDREKGALQRLASIMARYPTLGYYVQGDPRGAALWILRPGDVPPGQQPESCYTHGLPVYK